MNEQQVNLFALNNAKNYNKFKPIIHGAMIIIMLCLISLMFSIIINNQKQQHQVITNLYEKQSSNQPSHPIIDKNKYKVITLSNQLKVLIINNPDQKIAEVALSVKAGSFQEPNECAGTAHLLEHMLFLGTKSYPDYYYFSEFVANNGGTDNAFTDQYETNYYFTIQNQALQQALDSFKYFFIEPLLDEEMIQKEINAVHSEYEIITAKDEWKLFALLQKLSDKTHPFSRFDIGNKDTLCNFALREFFNNYYSSNLMVLTIMTNQNIQDIENLVQTFTDIPNKHLTSPTCQEYGQPIKDGLSFIKYRLDGNTKHLQIVHQLSDVEQRYKTKSMQFIIELINGQGGLKQYLIQQGLIISMESSIDFNDMNGCFSFLILDIIIQNQEQYLKIVQLELQYYYFLISNLYLDQGDLLNDTKELIVLWNNFKNVGSLQFNYNENIIRSIQQIAHDFNYYEIKDILSHNYLYEEYDPELIYFYLIDLLDLDNLSIFLGDSEMTEEVEYDKLNKVNFAILNFSDENLEQLQSFTTCDPPEEFQLPQSNKFLPKDLQIKSFCKEDLQKNWEKNLIQKNHEMVFSSIEDCLLHENEYEYLYSLPELVTRSSNGKLWWKLDRTYQLPTIFLGLKIEKINFHFQMLNIWLTKIEQVFQQDLQQAFSIGNSISITQQNGALILQIYGWSDNFDNLLKDVLLILTQKTQQESDFQKAKDGLKTKLDQLQTFSLFQQLQFYYLEKTLKYGYNDPKELLEQLDTFNYQQYQIFEESLFKEISFQMFVSGNILQAEAKNLYSEVSHVFKNKNSKQLDVPQTQKILKLQQAFVVPYQLNNLIEDSAILNYYIFGPRNRHQYAIMKLIQGMLNSQAFSYLRTNLQLGYVVRASFSPLECLDGIQIIIQGNNQTPYQIDKHINNFLNQFQQNLLQLTEEDILQLKQAALQQILQRERTLFESSKQYWNHIANNDFLFEEIELTADEIEILSKNDIAQFSNDIQKATKISIQLYGKHQLKGQPLIQYVQKHTEDKVTEQQNLKNNALLYQCSYKLSQI